MRQVGAFRCMLRLRHTLRSVLGTSVGSGHPSQHLEPARVAAQARRWAACRAPSLHAVVHSACASALPPAPSRAATLPLPIITHHCCRYDSDKQPPNSILQRAILNFINKETATLSNLPDAELQLKKAALNSGDADDGSASGSNADDDDEGSSCKEHAYDFNVAPPTGVWVKLSNGIRFMR